MPDPNSEPVLSGFSPGRKNTAYFPLTLVEIVGRIAFPLYSRLQGNTRLLGESFGRSVQLCAAFTAYFVALFLGMGSQVIEVVFGLKWLAALPLLMVYSGAIAIGIPLTARRRGARCHRSAPAGAPPRPFLDGAQLDRRSVDDRPGGAPSVLRSGIRCTWWSGTS